MVEEVQVGSAPVGMLNIEIKETWNSRLYLKAHGFHIQEGMQH